MGSSISWSSIHTWRCTCSGMLTGRLRDADRKRIEFGGRDTIGRVAARLVELADQYGAEGDGGVVIDLPFSQQELAGWIGSSRESVVKALTSMRARGWIETGRRSITGASMPALRARATCIASASNDAPVVRRTAWTRSRARSSLNPGRAAEEIDPQRLLDERSWGWNVITPHASTSDRFARDGSARLGGLRGRYGACRYGRQHLHRLPRYRWGRSHHRGGESGRAPRVVAGTRPRSAGTRRGRPPPPGANGTNGTNWSSRCTRSGWPSRPERRWPGLEGSL